MKKARLYFILAMVSLIVTIYLVGMRLMLVFGVASSGLSALLLTSFMSLDLVGALLLGLVFGWLAYHYKPENYQLDSRWFTRNYRLWINCILPYALLIVGETVWFVEDELQTKGEMIGTSTTMLQWPYNAGLIALFLQLIGAMVVFALPLFTKNAPKRTRFKIWLGKIGYLFLLVILYGVYNSFFFIVMYLSISAMVGVAIVLPFVVVPIVSIIKLTRSRKLAEK